MTTVAALNARLSLNSTAFTRGLSAAGGSTTLFGGTVKTASGLMRSFVGSIMAATGPLLGFAGIFRGMRVAEEFQQAMASSLAIVKEVSPQIRHEMERVAKDVAFNTKYSATEAAKAYYYLFSAGLDAQQSMKSLPQMARFAQAGMFDLQTATEAAAGALAAMGLKTADATQYQANLERVTDVLVKANTLAQASVQEFAVALKTDAANAGRMAGQSIEDVVAVLAAFAEKGIKGEKAGTDYARAINYLSVQATDCAEAFDRAGVKMFDPMTGNTRKLVDVIGDLETRFAGMSDEVRIAEMMTLGFSKRTIALINTLVGTSDTIRKWTAELKAAGGMTREVAEKQVPAFTKAWKQMKAIGEAWAIDTFTPWLDSLGTALSRLMTAQRHYEAMAKAADELEASTAKTADSMDDVNNGLSGMESFLITIADLWHSIRLVISGINASIRGLGAGLALLNQAMYQMAGMEPSPKVARQDKEAIDAAVKAMDEYMDLASQPFPSDIAKIAFPVESFEQGAKAAAATTESVLQKAAQNVLGRLSKTAAAETKAMEDYAKKAERLTEEFAAVTPLEKAQAKIADLNKLIEVGALKGAEGWETYRRARRAALEEYARAAESPGPPAAVRFGTREVIETLHRTQELQRNPLEGIEHLFPTPDETAFKPVVSELESLNAEMVAQGREQQRQTDILERVKAALGDIEDVDL